GTMTRVSLAPLSLHDALPILIADIDESAGRTAVASLGDAARFVRTDVGAAGDARNVVAEACGVSGDLDILVNNAGIIHTADFLRSEEHTSELQSQSNIVCRLL